MCKFDQDRFSNPRDYDSYYCTFLDETAKNRYIPPNISARTGPNVVKLSALVDITYVRCIERIGACIRVRKLIGRTIIIHGCMLFMELPES